jgi:hypothetical protein
MRQTGLIVLSTPIHIGLPTNINAHVMFELILSPLSPDLFSFSFPFFHSACAGWAQFVIVGTAAKIGNGPVISRITQAFASAVPPTNPSYPLHIPFRLAKFDWTNRADGGKDLQVYSPVGSVSPVISITGLYAVPVFCVPVPFGILPLFGFTTFLQSVTDSYEPLGPITGHTVGNIDLQTCATAAVYGSIKTAPPVSLDGGFYNIGMYFHQGLVNFTAAPYPAAWQQCHITVSWG